LEAKTTREVVPLHVLLEQRFPVGDRTKDVVRMGYAMNRRFLDAVLEFLWYDVNRVLCLGGLL